MKAKYKTDDRVKFELTYENETRMLTGTVHVVDYGTFRYPDKISYDVMVDDFFGRGKAFVKHVLEEELKPLNFK